MLYLLVFQHIAVERCAQLIEAVTGAAVSTAWVSAQLPKAAGLVEPSLTAIAALLVLGYVLHANQTCTNVAGVQRWLHVAAAETLALLPLASRSKAGAAAGGGVDSIRTPECRFLIRAVAQSMPTDAETYTERAQHFRCRLHSFEHIRERATPATPSALWADCSGSRGKPPSKLPPRHDGTLNPDHPDRQGARRHAGTRLVAPRNPSFGTIGRRPLCSTGRR